MWIACWGSHWLDVPSGSTPSLCLILQTRQVLAEGLVGGLMFSFFPRGPAWLQRWATQSFYHHLVAISMRAIPIGSLYNPLSQASSNSWDWPPPISILTHGTFLPLSCHIWSQSPCPTSSPLLPKSLSPSVSDRYLVSSEWDFCILLESFLLCLYFICLYFTLWLMTN